jgi:hypothetical protein
MSVDILTISGGWEGFGDVNGAMVPSIKDEMKKSAWGSNFAFCCAKLSKSKTRMPLHRRFTGYQVLAEEPTGSQAWLTQASSTSPHPSVTLYKVPAHLKSWRDSDTRVDMVFSPSRTQTCTR